MLIQVSLTDDSWVTIQNTHDDDSRPTKFARIRISLKDGVIADARDLRDLALACNAVAEHIERRST